MFFSHFQEKHLHGLWWGVRETSELLALHLEFEGSCETESHGLCKMKSGLILAISSLQRDPIGNQQDKFV